MGQQWGIDTGHGIIDGLGHAGRSLLLAPSRGALAERFRGVADAQMPFVVDTSRSLYRTGYDTDQLVVDGAVGSLASAVPPMAAPPNLIEQVTECAEPYAQQTQYLTKC